MKPTSLVPTLLAATLFLLAPARAADETPANDMNTPSAAAPNGPRHADIMKRFDKNKDGKLDEDEKAAAKAYNMERGKGPGADRAGGLGKKVVERFDKDGDGKLNDAEKAEAAKAFETNPRMLKRFDADKDGKLNDTEKAAARDAWEKQREKGAKKGEKTGEEKAAE